jgi:hypothetical protein
MGRVAKTTVNVTVNTGKLNPFTNGVIKGFVTLEEVTKGVNTNGKEFVIIPGFGVTYMRISEIKAGIKYGVVQFDSNTEGNEGALALNKISGMEELKYYMNQFPGSSMIDIKELFGIKL